MTTVRRFWLAFLFAAAAFAAAGLMYAHLPPRIPVHMDVHGTVDRWMAKEKGAFAVPVVMLVTIVVLIVAAPRTARDEGGSLERIYPSLVAVIAAFLLYNSLVVLLRGAGVPFDVPRWTTLGLGLLLMILGNSFGKLTRNFVVGIRTPWTLASPEVWSRTHRVGGWVFVVAGLATVIAALLGAGILFGIVAVLATGLVCVVYSYVLWRRIEGGHGG